MVTQFEKIASRKLGMNAQQAMKVAESLYSKGLISYPRTETNKYVISVRTRYIVLVNIYVMDQARQHPAYTLIQKRSELAQGYDVTRYYHYAMILNF